MKTTAYILASLLTLSICYNLWRELNSTRLAYVRSNDLIYGYFGMKEAMENYALSQKKFTANIDTLSSTLEATIKQARKLDIEKQREELLALERTIKQQQYDIDRLRADATQAITAEEQKLLKGVLAQVNAFVERYAKEHAYDVVLGTTDAGSLMYGGSELDITQEVLTALNEDHEGLVK